MKQMVLKVIDKGSTAIIDSMWLRHWRQLKISHMNKDQTKRTVVRSSGGIRPFSICFVFCSAHSLKYIHLEDAGAERLVVPEVLKVRVRE